MTLLQSLLQSRLLFLLLSLPLLLLFRRDDDALSVICFKHCAKAMLMRPFPSL